MATDVAAVGELRPGTKPGRRRLPLAWLVVVPFFAYTLLFLFLPAGEVLVGAFKGAHGGATFSNVSALIHTDNLRNANNPNRAPRPAVTRLTSMLVL